MYPAIARIVSKSWFRIAAYSFMFTAVSVVFMLALPFRDVYTVNQQHYFMHGLASAGYGYLANDWYVSTPDPYPLYSLLVSFTYTYLSMDLFYVYHAVCLGLFAFCLTGIVQRGLEQEFSIYRAVLMLTAIIIVFSVATSIDVSRVFGLDIRRVIRMWHGMADQYLVRRNFEPATIGVLLLVTAWLYLRGNRYLGCVIGGVAVSVDPVYLPHFGLLAISGMILTKQSGATIRQLGFFALVVFLCALPAAIHVIGNFLNSDPVASQEATRIFVRIRAPHHHQIAEWFTPYSVFQLVLGFVVLILSRKKPFFIIFAPLFAALTIILVVQGIAQNDRIGMFQPWRLSVMTTPLSLAALIGYAADFVSEHKDGVWRYVRYSAVPACIIVSLIWAYRGVQYRNHTFRSRVYAKSEPVCTYVRNHASPTDQYILPWHFDGHENSFRFRTGVPLYVEWKTVSFYPDSTVEWYRRMSVHSEVYSRQPLSREFIHRLDSQERLTHIVTNARRRARFDTVDGLRSVYADRHYSIYRVESAYPDSLDESVCR